MDKKPIQIYSAERFLPNTNIYGLEIPDKYKYIQVDDFLPMFATSLTSKWSNISVLKRNIFSEIFLSQKIFNRPGVAGAVLQSAPSLINYFIDSLGDPLFKISSKHTQSQTGRTRELTF